MSSVCSVRLSRNAAPALAPRRSSSVAAESTLTDKAGSLEPANGVFEMRERRVRQAPEIDHVGARRPHGGGTRENGIDAQRRRIDDLGEYAHVVTRQIEHRGRAFRSMPASPSIPPAHARTGRRIRALRRSRSARQRPGTMIAVGLHRTRQAARDDRLGHEGRDLDADIEDRPFETRVLDAGQNLLEPAAGRDGP